MYCLFDFVDSDEITRVCVCFAIKDFLTELAKRVAEIELCCFRVCCVMNSATTRKEQIDNNKPDCEHQTARLHENNDFVWQLDCVPTNNTQQQ